VTGRELQAAIVELGRTLGWTMAHFASVPVKRGGRTIWMTPAQADGKGFPDILAVRERAIAIEVKGKGDRLKPEQERWLTAFRIAGIEAFVWGPKDWGEGGVIETELARRHRRFPAAQVVPTPTAFVETRDDLERISVEVIRRGHGTTVLETWAPPT
jgi:VRR-NUC domain